MMHRPRLLPPRSAWIGALILGLGAALQAQTHIKADPVTALMHRPAAEQERAVAAVRAATAALADPWLEGLHRAATAASDPAAPRTPAFARRTPRKRAPGGAAAAPPFPLTVEYVFGLGTIGPEPALHALPKAARAAAEREAALRHAMLGAIPDADRTIAALLRRLDADPTGDRFAAFLESWRNGDESFYEALDRTAGTPDSVFFYDVMLGDFVSDVAPKKDPATAALRASLQAAHDALHDGFLAYRQYRAFREAVAWSLALPPAVPLPAHLHRYEEAAEGYSLRAQVQMLLACEGHDPLRVATMIVASAPAMPQPLWRDGYDPYPAWNALFQGRIDAMVAAAGSTDAFLARARSTMTGAATMVRDAASAVLAPGAPAVDHD